jgi:putative inorganic carbon (HCO3(-)) transporter
VIALEASPRTEAESSNWRWNVRPQAVGAAGWCLAGYVLLLPIQVALGPSLRIALSDLFIVAYLVLRLPRLRLPGAAFSIWHLFIGASLLVGLLVAMLSADLLTAEAVLNKCVGMAVLMATFACIVDFCTSDIQRLAWLCRVFLFGVLANLVVALGALYLQQADQTTLTWINFQGVRLSGLLIDPNAFGGVLVVALCLHYVSRVARQPLVRGAASTLLTITLPVGLVLTYSRSAWIGMLVAGAIAVWLCGVRLLVMFGKLVAVLGLVVLVAASAVLPQAELLASRPKQVGERTSIIQDAATDFASSPFVGIGLDVSDQRHGQIIHNTTIWFVTELGPLGLIALVGFLFAYWSKGMYAFRGSLGGPRALAAGLLSAHAGMYGLSMGIEALYQRSWWFVLAGLGVVYVHARRRDEERVG